MIRMCTKTTKKITNLGCHLLFFAFQMSKERSHHLQAIYQDRLYLSQLSLRYMYSHEEKHGKLLKEAPGSKCIQHDRTLLLHANEDIYKDVHSILPGMT